MANYVYVMETGTIAANTASLLADVQSEFKRALGEELDLDASTPQGTLIEGETTARVGVMKNNADMANLLNPDYSYGVFLKSICAFLGQEAGVDKHSVAANVEMTGDPGLVVRSGLSVKTSDGDKFILTYDVEIGASGKVMAIFTADKSGPIPMAVGILTADNYPIGLAKIEATAITSIVLGSSALNDAQMKTRRKQTLYAQGIASIGATKAELLALDNVRSVNVVENITGAPGVSQGIAFGLASSQWICVQGAEPDQNIAEAIWRSRMTACPFEYGTNNGTPVASPNGVSVVDPYSRAIYKVKFVRAVELVAYVKLTARQGISTANETAIQKAIVEYAEGNVEGEEGFVIGASVSAFELSGAVARKFPGIFISACSVAVKPKGTNPVAGDYVGNVDLKPFEVATLLASNITVVFA